MFIRMVGGAAVWPPFRVRSNLSECDASVCWL
jgi:hypothetical protein